MAATAWASILADTQSRIEGITPTVDAPQYWRGVSRPRTRGQVARSREFDLWVFADIPGVMTFGSGEDQLGRVIFVETSYASSVMLDDVMHSDLRDLIVALEPVATYPSDETWSLYVRSVKRDETRVTPTENGFSVQYPVHVIWREQVGR